MFDFAEAAVEGALAAGATYADARAMVTATEGLSARNGMLERLSQNESAGVGVRALIGSSWGFFATPDPSREAATRAGREAAAIAKASAVVAGPRVELADVGVTQADWDAGWQEHPFDVALSERGDLLVGVTATMKAVAGVGVARPTCTPGTPQKWFVSSQGHRISQHLVECGTSMEATAVGEAETQRRSYGGIGGIWGTRGYEMIRAADLPGNAQRVGEEAVELLSAPECPSGVTDLILGREQLALQIHESVGHAIELDRILGWEAAFAGTSFLDLTQLGRFRYGSELMNITADATLPGALGSFGYDDEGTPAQRVDIVKDGIWVGVLSGRDSAHVAGLPPGGMVRGDGWNRLPMVRMTNVGLLPGESSLPEIIAATDDGIYMETNRSWSIDDKRLNFQFGCEVGCEVKHGTPRPHAAEPHVHGDHAPVLGVAGHAGRAATSGVLGHAQLRQGPAEQVGHTGHPSVPGRFRGVRVGVRSK